MQLIPVVDLLGGQAVRAIRGNRSAYRPVESALCRTSDPLRVARILLEHCRSDKVYVADLDALTGGVPQTSVVEEILSTNGNATVWLDGGFAGREDAEERLAALGAAASRVTPIFGSESLRSHDEIARCFADRHRAILSLDLRQGRRLDPAACWADPSLWPARVIVMTLDRVGAFAGPDLTIFEEVRRRAPNAAVVGAGSIRDQADLDLVGKAGAHAWLVASALHDLRIPPVARDPTDGTLSNAPDDDAMHTPREMR